MKKKAIKPEVIEEEVVLNRDEMIWLSRVLKVPYALLVATIITVKTLAGCSKGLNKEV